MEHLIRFIESHQALLFYILLLVALVLTRIPVIGKYFRSVNTLVHEAGHAFTTLILSGEVIAVNLFADTSGNTVTKAKNRFVQILIALAGYPLSSAMGLLFLFLLSKGYLLHILFILVSITLLLMVLSIRNNYGLFWAGTFSLLNLLILYFNTKAWLILGATFFTLIIVTDAMISVVTLFVLSIRDPKKAGDATNLAKFTKIPAVIWALVLMGFSGYLAYLSIIHYFPAIGEIIN